jgi:hypothetical protein
MLSPVVRISPTARVKHAPSQIAVVVSGTPAQAAGIDNYLQRHNASVSISVGQNEGRADRSAIARAGQSPLDQLPQRSDMNLIKARRRVIRQYRIAGAHVFLVPNGGLTLSQYVAARTRRIRLVRPAKSVHNLSDLAGWKPKNGQIVELSVGSLSASEIDFELGSLLSVIDRSGFAPVSVAELLSGAPVAAANLGDAQSAAAPPVTATSAIKNGRPPSTAVESRSPASNIAISTGTTSSTTNTIGATRVAGKD